MKIDSRFWTSAAKDRLQWIKNKWQNLSDETKETMPYKKFRNQFLTDVGKLQKKRDEVAKQVVEAQTTRKKLIQIIGDRQLASARRFYNSRRN